MTTPDRPATDARHLAVGVAGIAISIGLLWWAARNVDLAEVGQQIRRARLAPLLAAVAIATSTFLIRAWRWGFFLRSDAGAPVPLAARWHSVAIGFMANNLLPLRAGEFLRAFSIMRLGDVRMTGAITSLVVERVLDALGLVALFVAGLLASGLPASTTVAGVSVARVATIAGVLGFGALVVGVIMVSRPQWTEAVLRRVLPDGSLRARLISIGHGVSAGLAVLGSPGRLATVVGLTLLLWLVNAASFWVMFAAFGIEAGFAGALLVQGALALGVSVPSTPGYVGPFEAAIVAVLELYGIPSSTGFSYAITYHVATFVPIVLLGFWSLARTPIAFSDLRRRSA